MTKQNSKQYFRSLTLLYFGLLFGQIAFSAITLYLNLGLLYQPDDSLRDIFIYIVPVFVINGFVTGHFIYKNRIKNIRNNTNLTSKMGEYRGAMIIRLAMLEGASLFAIIVYLLTADLIFIGMTGIIIAYFMILKPSRDKIVMELELNSTEKMKIGDENQIIAEY